MSTEMSSVKSAPSSSAPSCFDREISFSPTLIDRGRIDEAFYMSLSALATHLFLFNSLLWTDKTKWLVAWLRAPPTFLFVSNMQSDNLSKRTSLILNIPVFLYASQMTSFPIVYASGFWATTACWLFDVPWARSWATDNSLLAKGRWGGGSRELWSRSEGLSGGLCLAGRQAGGCDEWLAPALEAPDG